MKISKVKCSVCGEEKATNPRALESRIKKYGSIEEIEKKWICKKCKDLKKAREENKKEEEKSTETNNEPELITEEDFFNKQ
jgi:DNA-directed RNA polymerase subunit M/transcription elongation factor TFIIS